MTCICICNFSWVILAKRLWEFHTKADTIWADTFRKKYPSTSNVTKRKSLTWNNILKAKSICDESSRWIIRNGETTHFWYDNWIGHGPLRNLIQGPLHILDTTTKVKDCWDANGNWNLNALSFALPDQVHDIIGATPRPLLSTLSDLPMWNLSPNGQFNPRIAYLFAANLPLTHNAAAWNWLWKSHTLPRVKTFLWLACHDRLHTKNQPLKRHVINDDSCPLCLSYSETTIHILRDCPSIRPIWHGLSNNSLPPDFFNLNLTEWLKHMSTSSLAIPSQLNTPWSITLPLAVWSIWSGRNKYVVEAQPFMAPTVMERIKTLSQEITHTLPPKRSNMKNNVLYVGWKPPPFGSLNWIQMGRLGETRVWPRQVVW